MSSSFQALVESVEALIAKQVPDTSWTPDSDGDIAKLWGQSPAVTFVDGYPTLDVSAFANFAIPHTILVRPEYKLLVQAIISMRRGTWSPAPLHAPTPEEATSESGDVLSLSDDDVQALRTPLRDCGGITIQGSPGTGKSTFLLYFSIILLRHQIPFFYQDNHEVVGFICQSGVYWLPLRVAFQITRLESTCHTFWLLDTQPYTPPRYWPKSSLKGHLRSSRPVSTYIITPPSLSEALVCARLRNTPLSFATATYGLLGPCITNVVLISDEDIQYFYLEHVKNIISSMTSTTLDLIENVIFSGSAFSHSELDLVHRIFLVTPELRRDAFRLSISTSFVAQLMIQRLREVDFHTQSRFFRLIAKVTTGNLASGPMLQGLLHELLHSNPWPLWAFCPPKTAPNPSHRCLVANLGATPATHTLVVPELLISPGPPSHVFQAVARHRVMKVVWFRAKDFEDETFALNSAYYRPADPAEASFSSFVYNHTSAHLFVFQILSPPEPAGHPAARLGLAQLRAYYPPLTTMTVIIVSTQRHVYLNILEPQDTEVWNNIYLSWVYDFERFVSGESSIFSHPTWMPTSLQYLPRTGCTSHQLSPNFRHLGPWEAISTIQFQH
ncbi:hypothetical protein ONZ45_g12409 [Pleurotus djamor]|nr:hypothetical protein ONZ45_g12409 [Pleurotus djamor]